MVDGDIYGGGLVGSERNNNFDNAEQYSQASTSVGDVTIELNAGSVNNVYVGGYTFEGSEGVANNVDSLGAEGVFKGEVIDGSDAASSRLEIIPTSYAFDDGQSVVGFDSIASNGKVTGLNYSFDNKDATMVTGVVEFASIADAAAKKLIIGSEDAQGVVSTKSSDLVGATVNVDQGLLAFNAVGQTTMDVWAESVVRTTIGVKAQKENFGFGVEAGGAFGSDDTQGLFGQVRVDYRF